MQDIRCSVGLHAWGGWVWYPRVVTPSLEVRWLRAVRGCHRFGCRGARQSRWYELPATQPFSRDGGPVPFETWVTMAGIVLPRLP
jgi:hypothetical protein